MPVKHILRPEGEGPLPGRDAVPSGWWIAYRASRTGPPPFMPICFISVSINYRCVLMKRGQRMPPPQSHARMEKNAPSAV